MYCPPWTADSSGRQWTALDRDPNPVAPVETGRGPPCDPHRPLPHAIRSPLPHPCTACPSHHRPSVQEMIRVVFSAATPRAGGMRSPQRGEARLDNRRTVPCGTGSTVATVSNAAAICRRPEENRPSITASSSPGLWPPGMAAAASHCLRTGPLPSKTARRLAGERAKRGRSPSLMAGWMSQQAPPGSRQATGLPLFPQPRHHSKGLPSDVRRLHQTERRDEATARPRWLCSAG